MSWFAAEAAIALHRQLAVSHMQLLDQPGMMDSNDILASWEGPLPLFSRHWRAASHSFVIGVVSHFLFPVAVTAIMH